MYEAPKLNVVGDARDVVLGLPGFGMDADGTYLVPDWEYEQGALPIPPEK